jgi:hypothetical protein
MEGSSAEVAALFYVKALWKWRDVGSLASKLFIAFQNNFSTPVVLFYLSTNYDELPGKLANVTDILEIVRKDNHRKWTQPEVFAEIQIMHSAVSAFDADDSAGDAVRLADVVSRLLKRNACSDAEPTQQTDDSS